MPRELTCLKLPCPKLKRGPQRRTWLVESGHVTLSGLQSHVRGDRFHIRFFNRSSHIWFLYIYLKQYILKGKKANIPKRAWWAHPSPLEWREPIALYIFSPQVIFSIIFFYAFPMFRTRIICPTMKSLLHEQGRGLDIGKKISKGLTDGVDLIVQKKNVFPF